MLKQKVATLGRSVAETEKGVTLDRSAAQTRKEVVYVFILFHAIQPITVLLNPGQVSQKRSYNLTGLPQK